MSSSNPFTRTEMEKAPNSLLNKGRFANATVSLCEIHGTKWVVKDFAPKHVLVRLTLGRFFLAREVKALNKLSGLEGIPQNAFRLDRNAIAFRFLPGSTINNFKPNTLPVEFFQGLEKLVQDMHGRGIAHLDLRYRRNILVRDDGRPGIIDFQSQIGLDHLPGWLRRHFERVDISGVYKQWKKRSPATIDEARKSLLESHSRLRKLWVLRGYGAKKKPAAH